MLTWFNHEIMILVHRDRKSVRDIGLVMKNGDKSIQRRELLILSGMVFWIA